MSLRPEIQRHIALLDRARLAVSCWRLAFAASRAHDELTSYALRAYGDHGPQISGIIREHFPLMIKVRLRALCADMNAYDTKADEYRPKRMRRATFRNLRQLVKNQDGSGFYL